MEANQMISQVKKAISELQGERVTTLIQEYLKDNHDPVALVNDGLTAGLRDLGERFEAGDAFLPELVKGARIFQDNLKSLEPYLKNQAIRTKGKILIATVEGDIHDVGKNIAMTLFTSSGFDVTDMGINVSTDAIITKVREIQPDILGLSSLLTTTMFKQKEVIDALMAAGLRDDVKVIIGGAPCSQEWAREIGADGYAEDAFSGLRMAEGLLNRMLLE